MPISIVQSKHSVRPPCCAYKTKTIEELRFKKYLMAGYKYENIFYKGLNNYHGAISYTFTLIFLNHSENHSEII